MHAPTVTIDLDRIRGNVEMIRRTTSVDVIAVVKADAYGLGIQRVSAAIADVVSGFYVFSLSEAVDGGLGKLGKPTIALMADSNNPEDYLQHRIHPVVWDSKQAALLKQAAPVLSIDTSQQRFAAAAEEIDAILRAGEIEEAFTHATKPEHAAVFASLTAGRQLRRHVAGSALLKYPETWFDAVRPGLALYENAVKITAPLVEVRNSRGPAGYSGFVVPRFGVIRGGYSNGLRPGPAWVNGRLTRILEVGMQTSFIDCERIDLPGDRVTLLGDDITPQLVAAAWGTSPQTVLVHLCRAGERIYI
jgi:alanine racemase